MRILLGVIYWSNLLLGVPLSGIGPALGGALLQQGDRIALAFPMSFLLVLAILAGWGLLYGYHMALFSGKTPLAWPVFWRLSMQLNIGLVLLWIGFFLINMKGPVPPLLTPSETWAQEMVDVLLLILRQAGSPDPASTVLTSWMYWGVVGRLCVDDSDGRLW